MVDRAPRSLADLTRRAALGALGAGGLGFALFGPRGAKEDSRGRVVLDYWEKWTFEEGAAMEKVVKAFNESQDRIYVRYFAISEIDKKATIAIAGGSPPDVIGLWAYNIPGFAETNAILPLDAMGFKKEIYSPGLWPLITHKGATWGSVNTCGSIALYYNKKAFKDAGLDPERPPRTMDELDESCDKLAVKDATGRLERAGFVHTEPGWWSSLWGYYFGGSLYDQDRDQATVDDAANVKAYTWMQNFAERYGVAKLLELQSGLGNYSSAEQGFLSGRVAMVIQGPWLGTMINKYRPGMDYGVAPIPVDSPLYDAARPIALIEADVMVIPKGAPNPEAAMEFVNFTQRPEHVQQLSLDHCKASPLVDSPPEFFEKHPNRCVRVHDELAKSPRAFCSPRTRVWPEFKDEFEAGFQKMWRLEEPARSVLARIQQRMQKQLDYVAAKHEARKKLGGGAG